MTPANVMAETIKQVVKILKSPGCRFVGSLVTRNCRHSRNVRSGKILYLSIQLRQQLKLQRLLATIGQFLLERYPNEFSQLDRLCPIFRISNVTGEGLDYVYTLLPPGSFIDSR